MVFLPEVVSGFLGWNRLGGVETNVPFTATIFEVVLEAHVPPPKGPKVNEASVSSNVRDVPALQE